MFTVPETMFWKKLQDLTEEIRTKSSAIKVLEEIKRNSNDKSLFQLSETINREEVISKIEKLIENILEDVNSDTYPSFQLNKRGGEANTIYHEGKGMQMLADVSRHEISLANHSSLKRFTAMVICLATCYQLLQSNKYATKRDIYYSNVNFFENQVIVDECFSDISCMLGVPRHDLHVLSSSKGLVGGCLHFRDGENNVYDCSKNGMQVPNHVNNISHIDSDATFILVIEKEATYQRLMEYRLAERLAPCILLTGKGFPDINTRALLRKLTMELKIPAFAFVDADPHGIEIMCIYKYGSMSQSHESPRLTCPLLKWFGILPGEIEKFGLSQDQLIRFTNQDMKKINSLLKRQYVLKDKELATQIQLLKTRGKKAEIECLDSISHSFMTDIYLPMKFRNGEWV